MGSGVLGFDQHSVDLSDVVAGLGLGTFWWQSVSIRMLGTLCAGSRSSLKTM